jgi:hypothetical protein
MVYMTAHKHVELLLAVYFSLRIGIEHSALAVPCIISE